MYDLVEEDVGVLGLKDEDDDAVAITYVLAA